MTAKVSSRISHLLRKSPLTGQQLLACEGVSVAAIPGLPSRRHSPHVLYENAPWCATNLWVMTEPMSLVQARIFMDHRPKKRTELRRSVMTPRWGSELEEGSFYKDTASTRLHSRQNRPESQ